MPVSRTVFLSRKKKPHRFAQAPCSPPESDQKARQKAQKLGDDPASGAFLLRDKCLHDLLVLSKKDRRTLLTPPEDPRRLAYNLRKAEEKARKLRCKNRRKNRRDSVIQRGGQHPGNLQLQLPAKEVRNWLPDSCKELSDVLDIARVHAIHGVGLAIAVERARQAKRANKASFESLTDAVDDGIAAIRRGDFAAFVNAAEVLLPNHLSMLNMASFNSCHNDRSLLHYAAIYNDLPAARWLLQHGASPSLKSEDGDSYGLCSTYWTPLHHAACTGNVGMCRLLLSAGADVEAQIARGDVHLDNCEAECLMGLEPSTKRFSAGSRPVDVAESMGHVAVVEILQPFVLTLHMGEVSPHGHVDVAVTNLGGDEVASITADLNNRVESLRILISETIEEWASCLFMLPNGNVLSDDAARLGDVLEGAAIVGDERHAL